MSRIYTIIVLLLGTGLAFANPIQSLEVIKLKIEQYILQDLAMNTEGSVKVSADKIDSRLQLKACAEANLEVFNPYRAPVLQSSTMGIKCLENDNHWTLYVPVKISVFKKIYVASHTLHRGQPITEQDLRLAEKDIQLLKKGYFLDMQTMIGQVCRQTIAEGAAISPQDLQQPRLVFKGQQVNIMAGNENFSVKMPGVAMRDGVLGEMIGVKNLSSKRIVEARVIGDHQVSVQ